MVQAGLPILTGVLWGLQHLLVTLGPLLKGYGRGPGLCCYWRDGMCW